MYAYWEAPRSRSTSNRFRDILDERSLDRFRNLFFERRHGTYVQTTATHLTTGLHCVQHLSFNYRQNQPTSSLSLLFEEDDPSYNRSSLRLNIFHSITDKINRHLHYHCYLKRTIRHTTGLHCVSTSSIQSQTKSTDIFTITVIRRGRSVIEH